MFSSRKKLPLVYVNYNSVRDGVLNALLTDANQSLQVEQRVLTTDEEGHSAEGTVEKIEDLVVTISIDWQTWTNDEHKDSSEQWVLIVAMIFVVLLAVASGLLLHNVLIGIVAALVALLVILFNQ